MKVKTNHVPEDCDYLNNGKIYEIIKLSTSGDTGQIIDNNGEEITIRFKRCAFLRGHNWEIIGEEDD